MTRRLRSLGSSLTRIGRSLTQLPGGRRTKYAVIGIWLVVAVAIGPLSGKFEDAQENDPVDYLPGSAESVKALNELEDYPSGDIADAVTVFRRDGGLTAADRAEIAQTRGAINAERRDGVGETGSPVISNDGTTALLSTPITVKDGSNEASDLLVDATDDIKAQLAGLPDGLQAKVTGPAGFSADAIDVFGDINGTLLFAAAAIVLVLLIVAVLHQVVGGSAPIADAELAAAFVIGFFPLVGLHALPLPGWARRGT